ncbi:MAG: hypothetical protein LCH51_11095 [Bacteroidetes bacterium]|nr:hypothetical protein [Bacteroidota bacterium]
MKLLFTFVLLFCLQSLSAQLQIIPAAHSYAPLDLLTLQTDKQLTLKVYDVKEKMGMPVFSTLSDEDILALQHFIRQKARAVAPATKEKKTVGF